MPDQLEQAMLNRQGDAKKGNADIAKLQELAKMQQRSGNPGLLQRLFGMFAGKPEPTPATELVVSENRRMPDVNLPDEMAGQNVGMLHSIFAGSKDPNKEAYLRSLQKSMHVPPTLEEELQHNSARQIFGGDADDPRLAELADRKKYIGQRSYPLVSLGK